MATSVGPIATGETTEQTGRDDGRARASSTSTRDVISASSRPSLALLEKRLTELLPHFGRPEDDVKFDVGDGKWAVGLDEGLVAREPVVRVGEKDTAKGRVVPAGAIKT